MITLDKVLFFDCETTGLPTKGAEWQTDFETFPRICQLSWMLDGREENHIIRPDGWKIPDETTEIHGITMHRAMTVGEPFANVVQKFLEDCKRAELLCGHNVYFDVSIIKSELMRLNFYELLDAETALYKGKRIDTMRPSMNWVGAKNMYGRVKYPKLTELYSKCFPGETFPAHDAMCDVRAVARCLPILVANGIIALEVKQYPEEVKTEGKAENRAVDEKKSEDNKTYLREEKSCQNEKTEKITSDIVSRLMSDENF